ncbi:hypothetical protein LA080_016006 [Diaporthe eres]|nr:hypothetical protein LA080_016006 [Diaporthe eres]
MLCGSADRIKAAQKAVQATLWLWNSQPEAFAHLPPAGRNAVSNLEEKGIETFILDVTKPESIAALKDEITRVTGGTLNILFNNAGAQKARVEEVEEVDPYDVDP